MVYEYIILLIGLIGLLLAFVLYSRLKKKSEGTKKMAELSGIIKQGAKTYLKKQYRIITIVAFIMAIILAVFINIETGIAFLFGAFLSAIAGIIGMIVATSANARTAQGCRKSLGEGLKIAFSSGAIMG